MHLSISSDQSQGKRGVSVGDGRIVLFTAQEDKLWDELWNPVPVSIKRGVVG